MKMFLLALIQIIQYIRILYSSLNVANCNVRVFYIGAYVCMFSKLQDRVFTSPAVLRDYLFLIRERHFCSDFKHVLRSDEMLYYMFLH